MVPMSTSPRIVSVRCGVGVTNGVDAAMRLDIRNRGQRQHVASRRLDWELAQARQVRALAFGEYEAHLQFVVLVLEDLDAPAVVGGSQLSPEIARGETKRAAGRGEAQQPLVLAPRQVVAQVGDAVHRCQFADRLVRGALQGGCVLAFQQNREIRRPAAHARHGKRIDDRRALYALQPLGSELVGREVALLRRRQFGAQRRELNPGLGFVVDGGDVRHRYVIDQIAAAPLAVGKRQRLLEVRQECLLLFYRGPGDEPHVGADFLEIQVQIQLRLDPAGRPNQQHDDEEAERGAHHNAAIGHREAHPTPEALFAKALERRVEALSPQAGPTPATGARARRPLECVAQVPRQNQKALHQRGADDHRHDHADFHYRRFPQGD